MLGRAPDVVKVPVKHGNEPLRSTEDGYLLE
jgi:hypothetical protein